MICPSLVTLGGGSQQLAYSKNSKSCMAKENEQGKKMVNNVRLLQKAMNSKTHMGK